MADIAMYTEIDALSQTDVIKHYAPMVKRIAHHLLGRLPNNIQVDDLIQAGMIGLLEASKNYDPTKGASFETYSGIRVRGSMLDEVRKNDWLPRSVYRNARRISEAVRVVENRMQRDARDSEIAEELEVDLPGYHQLLRDTSCGQLYGFEDVGLSDDVMSDRNQPALADPFDVLQKKNFHASVTESIRGLPEREQLILSLYYDDEMNLREIGMILGVSESRVCQIHSQAMLRIQARMPDWKNT